MTEPIPIRRLRQELRSSESIRRREPLRLFGALGPSVRQVISRRSPAEYKSSASRDIRGRLAEEIARSTCEQQRVTFALESVFRSRQQLLFGLTLAIELIGGRKDVPELLIVARSRVERFEVASG